MELQPTEIMGDEEIVALYFRRDERAIRETDGKYGKYLLTVAHNILHDSADSEECLNDTYIGAWNTIPPAKPAVLQAFLCAIMRRKAIDRYKAERRKKRIPSELTASLSEIEDFIADGEDMNSDFEVKELGRIMNDYVRSLSERRMYIFMGRYYVARPICEIARRLGCSESTVNKEIAAIKRELKKKLESEGYTV